jgi:hypothetical protein
MINTNKKFVSINYTSRDFNSIRADLVNYANRYYPELIKDFTQASFASLMVDTTAYVGDLISFYLDYQFNESFLASANDYESVLKLAKQLGYKHKGAQSAFGKVAIYAIIPSNGYGLGPNNNYLPIIRRNSIIGSNTGLSFILTEDVDFNAPNLETVVARIDQSTGNPTSFAVRAYGNVVSGRFERTNINVGPFEKFKRLSISDPNISEIVSVFDSNGNQYFEVDYLSQDVVYKSIINTDPVTREQAPSVMVPVSVPRRFVVEHTRTTTDLIFGHGSDDMFVQSSFAEPANVLVDRFARNYITDDIFDPSNLIANESFGIAPANTTLRVVYRTNNYNETSVGTGQITKFSSPIVDFVNPRIVSTDIRVGIINSLETYNEEPITSANSIPNIKEIKLMALDNFASQGRAVTAQDYESLIYRMPNKFGSIARVRAVRDPDSLKRNINLYVLGKDVFGKLNIANTATKNNKNWINNYRMINDSIDILDGRILNIGLDFEIVVSEPYNKFEVLNRALVKLRTTFNRPYFMGEPFNIYEIYSILNDTEGVADVVKVNVLNIRGTGYSSDYINIKRYTTPDGRQVIPPENAIFEFKFPLNDINGATR